MKTQNRNYVEHEVVNSLNKKHDIQVDSTRKIIKEIIPPHSKGDVGIKSRGKIDFLMHYCGYTPMYVTTFKD